MAAVGALLRIIGLILFRYYGWTVIVAVLAYLIWQNRRRAIWASTSEHVLLKIEVPKENEKDALSAEQLFASLHGILRPEGDLAKEGSLQEHISFEIAGTGGQIQFYVWVPKHLTDFVEGQIYAQYPQVRITQAEADYAAEPPAGELAVGTELELTKPDALPIKTFPSFEVDPLAGITGVLARLGETKEQMWIQILARPVSDKWAKNSEQFIKDLKAGKTTALHKDLGLKLLDLPIHIITNFFSGLANPPGGGDGDKKKDDKKKDDKDKDEPTGQKAVIKAVEEKMAKLGYEVKIRLVYIGPDQANAKDRMQAIVGGFKQFNTNNLNGFTTGKLHEGEDFLTDYRARLFASHSPVLNIEELASLYHLPHKSVETPGMVWTPAKASEPPFNLPTEVNTQEPDLSLFGLTNFRGHQQKFGLKREDRGRHLYIIGQTGTGKSFLLQLLALSDIYHNEGIAIVDPHGDFATDIMKYIPEHRVNDVIYFNPSDRDYPIAFNPLEVFDPNFKSQISSELVGVLKRMFESWGPRLEYILRFTILALLDSPDSTMLGITRMLTDKVYRKQIVSQIKDPVVKNFWVQEFASWNEKFANEAVAPVLNKVGAFTTNPLVRHVVGQSKSTIDLRKVMDEGKILIVNLSQGLIGEDNAAVLGALMVTKIQLAAMSRADVDKDKRRPFYLYVDEFQNFATDTFAVILSEARKYGLYLTVANQYIAQMPETVREAVFGNVGSMITFRIGAGDAAYLGKYFEPIFEPADLVRLHNRSVYITMSIDGEKTPPFSAQTLRMPEPQEDHTVAIVDNSRRVFATPRKDVEAQIADWAGRSEVTGDLPRPDERKPNMLSELKNANRQPNLDNRSNQTHQNQPGNQIGNQPRPAQGQNQGGGQHNLEVGQAVQVRE